MIKGSPLELPLIRRDCNNFHQEIFQSGLIAFRFHLKIIPHQTTTYPPLTQSLKCCNSSYFYIKPQPWAWTYVIHRGCNSSNFYIKPQRKSNPLNMSAVVIHLISTSNHNLMNLQILSICVVIHLISTSNHNPVLHPVSRYPVVIHLISTSNHNFESNFNRHLKL